TRDVIEEYLNIQGIPVRIMDTAGIREVKDIAEKEGVKRSLRTMENADLVLLVLDGSRALHDTDRELVARSMTKNTILVINKIDLPQKAEISEIRAEKGPGKQAVKVSATERTGLDELKEKVVETALKGKTSYGTGMITNVRHVQALETALRSIEAFSGKVEKLSPEFLSVELRDALDAIGEILGATTPEDVLNKIFNDFCIGK
ncbi:MAG TPA: GTP-binding protein, partial [Nitrospirae bacterium]|nr:GTP-binding protein [Nitrospirota bacterium]